MIQTVCNSNLTMSNQGLVITNQLPRRKVRHYYVLIFVLTIVWDQWKVSPPMYQYDWNGRNEQRKKTNVTKQWKTNVVGARVIIASASWCWLLWSERSQCTMCTLYSFFSFRPSVLGHILQPEDCHIIEHIFVPTHSVERNIEKSRFPWASNSKFVIFPQIFPCSNYKLCPIIPL